MRHYPPRSTPGTSTGWSRNRNAAAHARFARAVRRRAGNQCELCTSTDRLQAHHRNGDATDNRVENGILLCHTHHKALDPHAR